MGYFKAYDKDDKEVQTTKNKETKESYDAFFSNKISIASCTFDTVSINKGDKKEKIADEKVVFTASWKLKDDETLSINDILEFIGIKSLKIPKGIDLALNSANIKRTVKENYRIEAESKNYGKLVFVSYKENKNDESKHFLSVKTDKNINLTNLPLVNQVFDKKHSLAIEDIQVVYASDEFEDRISEKINKFIKDGYGKIDKDIQKGFCISLDLDIADHSEKLILATDNGNKKTKQNIDSGSKSSSTGLSKDTNKTIQKSNDGTLWCKVNKKLGPVSFEKIGLKYEEGKLFIAINSSLLASGLNIDLVQASISTRLDKFHPEFNLRGLGVGYDNSTFEISGTLITTPHKKDNAMEYTGGVVLKTKSFNLEAFGSYYDSDNDTSMFIFLEVDRVFGGPPSFVVTGLLGGFGYNSKLRIPDISEINDFPLTAGLDNPSLIGKNDSKKATTPTQAIAKLTKPEKTKPWITPKAGNIWVAAGVKFTSFELMNSIAILVGEFGKDFSLAIIGKSKGQYPKKGKPLVNFELDLRAYFNPNMGELSFISQLSDKSYLLDKNCHLRGGFAMCFWFGDNRYSGDFVISMGGYSPYFSKPSHYPALDRVGINWQINDNISIKGENYFTITPSAAMAGGNLNLLFKSGSIRAWVKARYDVIVWWNPFYFIADIAVRVGASVKVLGKRISVELGCMLGLWGPALGGKVKVKILSIITFTISFGASRRREIQKLTWDQFKENLPDSENYIKVIPLAGVAPKEAVENKKGESINNGGKSNRIIVKPNRFEFKTESQIPNSKLKFKNKVKQPIKNDSKKINIKPMREKALDSVQEIEIIKVNGKDNTLWEIEKNIQKVPESLWGSGSQGKLLSGEKALIESPIGFIIKAPAPEVSNKTLQKILEENISYSEIDFDRSFISEDENGKYIKYPLYDSKKEKTDFTTSGVILKIEKISENKKRDSLHQNLCSIGFDLQNGSLEKLSQEVNCHFTDHPMVKKA